MDYFDEGLTFVLGAIGSYLAVGWKVRKDLEAKYDKTLRDARLEVYQSLWASLQHLAKYSRPAPVTTESLKQLSAQLREWYFVEGGLYLSKRARNKYFRLQDGLQNAIERGCSTGDPAQELDAGDFEPLRLAGSRLRSAMAADAGTRKAPLLKPED